MGLVMVCLYYILQLSDKIGHIQRMGFSGEEDDTFMF